MAARTAKPLDLNASMRIVVFHGKDDFQRRERMHRFMDALREKYGELDEFAYDGATCATADVLDELRSYDLLQRHKVVILDAADDFLKSSEEDKGPSPKRAAMERYVESPVEDATLIMRAATWRPGNLDKKIKKCGGAIVKCEPPAEGQAVTWCIRRASERLDCEIDRQAANMLVELIGNDLQRLDVELAKLARYAGSRGEGKTVITPDDVRQMVGLSREEQAWVIQDALLSGRADLALTRLRELIEVSRVDPVPLFWSICDVLRKLHAACRLAEQGESGGAIAGKLRLWGPSRDAVLRLARRHNGDRFAQLLRQAIETDRKVKSGLADQVQSLEGLAVIVADSIGCSLRAA